MAPRCLIVDDSDCFLQAAREMLHAEGIAVVGVASTTAEALDRCAESRPDVVLMDVDLGQESGLDAAQRIADTAADGRPRVILISARHEEDLAELIEASPAIAFLPKLRLSGAAVNEALWAADSGSGLQEGADR
ncbi:response regulator [Microbispora sp. NBC_01389]|uniref:response regulator n=1 Tax=Microbispora sp. NBC_01389 TaxID=2903584 RepID=UPI00324361E8